MSSLPVFDPAHHEPADDELASGMDRRDFLAKSGLAAVAAALFAACGNGLGGSSMTGPSNVNVTVTLTNYSTLGAVGGVARLSGVSTPIAVVRSGAGSYRAFSLICPHAGSTVNVSGSGFLCPNHGASFSSTGANNGGIRTSNLFEFTVVANAAAGTLTITS
jgi:Rieske Fe-S protein